MTPIPNEIKEMSGTPIVTANTNGDVSNNCNTPTISKSIEEFPSRNRDTYEGEIDGERTLDKTYFPKNKHESCSSVDTSDKNSNIIKMHNFCCYHHCHHCDTCMCVNEHHTSENKSTKTDSMDINGYHEEAKELNSTISAVENTENENLKNINCDQTLNSSVNNVPFEDEESLLNNTSCVLLTNCLKGNDSRQQKRKLEDINTSDEIMELKKCKTYSEDPHENSKCSSKLVQNESIGLLVNSEDHKKDCVENLIHTETSNSKEVQPERSVSLENSLIENRISSVSSKDHKNSDCLEMVLQSEVCLSNLKHSVKECDFDKFQQNTSEDSLLVNSENITEVGKPLENNNKECLVDSESQKEITDSTTQSLQDRSEDSLLVNAENSATVETPLENEIKECLIIDSESQKENTDCARSTSQSFEDKNEGSLLVRSENSAEVGKPLENETKDCLIDSKSQRVNTDSTPQSLQDISEDSLIVNSENSAEVEKPLENENKDCLGDSESLMENSDSARSTTQLLQDKSEGSLETVKTNSCDNAPENSKFHPDSNELISNDSNAIKTEDDKSNSPAKLNLGNKEPIADNLDAVKIHSTDSNNKETIPNALDPVKSDSTTLSNANPNCKEIITNNTDAVKFDNTTPSPSKNKHEPLAKRSDDVEETASCLTDDSDSGIKEPRDDKLDAIKIIDTSSSSESNSKEPIELEDTPLSILLKSVSNNKVLIADKLDVINPTTSSTSDKTNKKTSVNHVDAVKIDKITSSSSEKSKEPTTEVLDVIQIEDDVPCTSDNCSSNKKTRFSDGIDPSEIKRLKQVRVVIDPLDQIKAKVVLQNSSLNTIFNPAKVVLNRIKTVGNISRRLSSGAGSSKANTNSSQLLKVNNEPSIVITLSSDSEESEEEDEIRIGAEYQAVVEDIVDPPRLKAKDSPEDIAMWKPHASINSENVHSFIQKAKNQYNYREDQALGLLFHHQYNFTTAYAELSKYYMLKKNWTKAEKDKFEKLISKYRKNFDQIQVNMPHKTMREIIAYYYERKVELKKMNRLTKNKKAKPAKSFLVRRTHNRRTSPQ